MTPEPASQSPTLALNTRLEDDFIAPLTAVRGALELLHDHPDLAAVERQRFVATALRSCAHLEKGVMQLAETVYAAAQQTSGDAESVRTDAGTSPGYAERVHLDAVRNIVEIDCGGLEFANARMVYDFYDALEAQLAATGHRWYFVVDHTDCSVWPEAWVAFAYRGKRAQAAHALGCARYASGQESGEDARNAESAMFASREEAISYIDRLQSLAGN